MHLTSMYTDSSKQALMILGDGSRDKVILKYAFEKLNGERVELACPEIPLFFGRKGLHALEALALALDKFKVKVSVFIVDKEHIKGTDEIKRTLANFGFTIKDFRALSDRAFKAQLIRGDKAVKLYIALSGQIKSIEEDLEVLAKHIGHRSTSLRTHEIRELFKKARKEDVERAFKHLALITSKLKEDLAQ